VWATPPAGPASVTGRGRRHRGRAARTGRPGRRRCCRRFRCAAAPAAAVRPDDLPASTSTLGVRAGVEGADPRAVRRRDHERDQLRHDLQKKAGPGGDRSWSPSTASSWPTTGRSRTRPRRGVTGRDAPDAPGRRRPDGYRHLHAHLAAVRSDRPARARRCDGGRGRGDAARRQAATDADTLWREATSDASR